MIHRRWYSVFWYVVVLVGAAALLTTLNCGRQDSLQGTQGTDGGKQSLAGAPATAYFGQIYRNPADNREYIYDGVQWVPHDATVDEYYQQAQAASKSKAMLTAQKTAFAPPGTCGTGTGAHAKHAGFDCKVCHLVGGLVCFDPAGPAVAAGLPAPSFDEVTKTCSNVACHGVPAGTFSYYMPGNEDADGDGYPDPVLITVHYGGTYADGTPSWYATVVGCAACHGNPPVHGSDGSNVWHSGFHANNQNLGTPGPNDCELCHNDPTVPYPNFVPIAFSSGGQGYQINPAAASQHANGTATVYAKFKSICFNCH